MVNGLSCIITGCTMLVPANGDEKNGINGDLFQLGDYHYVFVGNRVGGKDTILEDPSLFYTAQFTPNEWFDRRGVYIMHRADVTLNEAAHNYILGR